MTRIAIETSDMGLEAAVDAAPLGEPSPGYVLLDHKDLVTGTAARAQSRLRPRFVSHRHWDRMNLEAAGRPFPRGLTQGDLIYAHLSQYWAELLDQLDASAAHTSVLLAVPASYSAAQLGLLLGIARAVEIPVRGLVDSAVASVDEAPAGLALHLDIRLQRAVWTALTCDDSPARAHVTRADVRSVDGAGMVVLRNAWAHRIAETFVRETRFDPLHRGSSEQTLFDGLDAWVDSARETGAATITLETSGEPQSVEITSSQLEAAASAPLEALCETARALCRSESPSAIFLSSRAATVPGLAARLADLDGASPTALPRSAAALGTLARHAAIEAPTIEAPGSDLSLVTSLPAMKSHG